MTKRRYPHALRNAFRLPLSARIEHMFVYERGRRTCSFPDCDRAYYAKGLCRPHYTQQLHKRPLNRSVPGPPSRRSASLNGAIRGRPIVASARPMPGSVGRVNRYAHSVPSMAPRAPAASTAAQNLAQPEATASATPPSTTVAARWPPSSSPRQDATSLAARSAIMHSATVRAIDVNFDLALP